MASTTRGERILYQFPISHYCEKTRWNLDAKGLSYRIENLVPGWHRITTRRISRTDTVPLLIDGGAVIGDSAAIAAHLELAYPERPLLPAAGPARERALELEAYFGNYPGRSVRQWIYGQLGARRGAITEILMQAYSPGVRRVVKLLGPLLEAVMRRGYRLHPEGIARARATIFEAFDRLEREIGGDPARYLAGDAFSIVDLTAASMLAPLVAPPESPWAPSAEPGRAPPSVVALREELGTRPAWAWVTARYAQDRRRT